MRKIKPDTGQAPPDPVTPLDLAKIFNAYPLPPDQIPVKARRPNRIREFLLSLRAILRRLRPGRFTKR
jgi:hypothetical protein